MARSRQKGAASARSSSSKAAKKPRKAATVEVVEENDGGGLDAAIAIFTLILLVAGFLMLDYQLGSKYGEGALFADSYQAPAE